VIIKDIIHDLAPPLIWRTGKRLRRALGFKAKPPPLPPPPIDWRATDYQGVRTIHNARPLHVGPYAEILDRHASHDPWHAPDVVRYRHYNICQLAKLSRDVPGDFLVCGVSWGVAARMVYEYLDFASLGKTFHFVDPFIAIDNAANQTRLDKYNSDPEYVRRQYPVDAPIKFHRVMIPSGLPLPVPDGFSFIHLATGDEPSEAQSLPYFFERLNRGGWIVIDNYAIGDGAFDHYDPTLDRLGIEPIWLPSGQGAIMKL
jgi:hypothetical protein